MKWTPQKSAGIAYLLPTAVMGLTWYILAFPSYVPMPNYSETLQIWFVESPERAAMWKLALFSAFGLFMAVAYFSGLGHTRGGAIALCAAGTLVAAVSWVLTDTMAVFFTIPLLFSVPLLFAESRAE